MRPARGLLALLAAALLLGACSDDLCAGVECSAPQRCQPLTGQCLSTCDTVKCPDGLSCQESTGTCISEAPPPRPAIGALIDRVGRPAIGVLVLNPFDRLQPAEGAAREAQAATQDRYNQDGDAATWVTRWAPALAESIAIYDGLDGTCGNSLQADLTQPRYSTLSRLLANDALHLDASAGSCRDNYLAVESKAFGASIIDCGGRTLQADVIDTTYSVITTGAYSGVTDGVGFSANVSSDFPFLGVPPL